MLLKPKTNKQTNKQTNKKTVVGQINETRSRFFERISKIDKPLASLIKKEKERTQISKINTTEIKTIIGEYYEQLYANKMGNLE